MPLPVASQHCVCAMVVHSEVAYFPLALAMKVSAAWGVSGTHRLGTMSWPLPCPAGCSRRKVSCVSERSCTTASERWRHPVPTQSPILW